jgi:hypothetical protein
MLEDNNADPHDFRVVFEHIESGDFIFGTSPWVAVCVKRMQNNLQVLLE